MSSRVLVTGGSGFIAGHIILQLIEQGHLVRATVRSLEREEGVRRTLSEAGLFAPQNLQFVAADLTADRGWAEAVQDVDYVLHVASPLHTENVKDENDVIRPAREGTLRVLRAARDAGVRRVVLTSAFHSVGFGHPHTHGPFTEDDWSVIDGPGVDAYGKSKILAERAAWDFITREGGGTELTTILPVAVMGPVLGQDVSGANHIVQRSLNGEMPGYPNMYVPIVDVRDVAAAHVAAMSTPAAAGQRILVSTGQPAMAMRHIGEVLKANFGEAAKKVPSRRIPDFIVRLTARFKPEFRPVAADLGFVKQVSNDRLTRILGLSPRSPEQAIVDSARSLINKSLV
ncbi:aldehyde reductase [Kineosporia mesophila]|uniref:Aldehyde reductase n=2 Tax=Kineosporia mesophila TaxID=566012 RepID=A0ABP6ZPQ2_9ACTN